MYDEVGHEIKAGFENVGEIAFVYLGLVINALFCLLAVGLAIFASRKPHGASPLDRGAPIFMLAQYMGIVSGFLGLFLTILLTGRKIPVARLGKHALFL